MSGPLAERVTEEHHGYAGGATSVWGHGGHVGAPIKNYPSSFMSASTTRAS
jgi:hypothetical protein